MYDTGVRMIPLDGCYMLQRYRPDYDDWVNFAVYATEAAAHRRLQRYTHKGHSTMSNDDILKLAVQAGIHSAVVFVSHGSNIEALTHREQQDYASVQHFARLLISALNKKETA
jgi:hypothetical protein